MKIYIVGNGASYSAWDIEAVFSSKDLADAYVQKSGDWKDVEEYDVDGLVNATRKTEYECLMALDNGDCEHSHRPGDMEVHDWTKVYPIGRSWQFNRPTPMIRIVSTVSEEHAHKCAVEARKKQQASKSA